MLSQQLILTIFLPLIGAVALIALSSTGRYVARAVALVVTLLTPAPDKETQDMVDEIRIPKGETVLGSTH